METDDEVEPESTADPSGDTAVETENNAKAEPKNEQDKSSDTQNDAAADTEAEEAVVAGVAAVGGIMLKLRAIKRTLKNWWDNKRIRYTALGSLAAVIGILLIIPTTRYGVFNSFGIRANIDLLVVDGDTNLPLKGASVQIGSQTTKTDDRGYSALNGVRLGNNQIVVSKLGYAETVSNVRIGIGNNNLGQVGLVPTGTRFTFNVKHWLSGQPIGGAFAQYGDSNAYSDDNGVIKLTIPPTDQNNLDVTVSAKGYLDKTLTIDATKPDQAHDVELLDNAWQGFISKRNGRFDVYRSRLDGSEQEMIVQGSEQERASTFYFSVSPSSSVAALVSTRDGKRNSDGYVLSGLYIINLETSDMKRIDLSESINIWGWIGNYLVYSTQKAGASGYNPERFALKSYSSDDDIVKTLESSNSFYDILVANGGIYYAPYASYKQSSPTAGFYSVQPDGTNRRLLLSQDTRRIVRTKPDRIVLETVDDTKNWKQTWYEYIFNTGTTNILDGPPASFDYWSKETQFIDNWNDQRVAWVEDRDGQTVIMALKTDSKDQQEIWHQPGIMQPLRWVNDNMIVFRVKTDTESADYIVSLDGKDARKITDVTNVPAISSSYYGL